MTEDEENKIIFDNIAQYGCHVLHVQEEGDHPRFSYSIGIKKQFNKPELIVTGLQFELAHAIINDYCQRIQNGEIFEIDQFYGDFIEGFDVTFKQVQKKHYKEFLGYGLWLYKGNDFDTLQMIYPSVHGKFPWDDDAPDDYVWFIPPLHEE